VYAVLEILVHHVAPGAGRGAILVVPLAALLLASLMCWYSWSYLEKPLVSWARRRFRY
jgi:peptidoglycan/LPS O-acetylase OafA/YrhL